MENQVSQNQQLIIPSHLNQLASSLKIIAPANSETTQLITYTLLATAMVGIFVYHYIKTQEQTK